MEQNKQTQPLQIQVLRDGQPEYEYMPMPPSPIEAVGQAIVSKMVHVTSEALLQAQMGLYDLRMGTHYRSIRNELIREKRNRDFEQRIGIVKVK